MRLSMCSGTVKGIYQRLKTQKTVPRVGFNARSNAPVLASFGCRHVLRRGSFNVIQPVRLKGLIRLCLSFINLRHLEIERCCLSNSY